MSSSRDRLLKQFRELVVERLGKISRGLMELEAGPNPEAGKGALRELHGLKGEARMMGFAEVNKLVHEMEELVRSAEKAGYALTGGSIDALLVVSDAVAILAGATEGPAPDVAKLDDWLKQRVEAEKAHLGSAPAPSAPAPVAAGSGQAQAGTGLTAFGRGTREHTVPVGVRPNDVDKPEPAGNRARVPEGRGVDASIRIDQKALDLLTSAVGSLQQITRRRELGQQRRLRLARDLAQLARMAEDLGPVAADIASRLNRAKELAAELHREAKLLANEELRDLTRVSEEVQAIRMLPLSVLFEPYPRMVRDLSRELGKEVELVVHGEDTRADRSVIEALKDPLLHLVRNALDHGIERREDRERMGKGARGKLSLNASREGESIVLEVRDDGAGLNVAELRKAAVRKGFVDEAQAQAMPDAAVRELVFVAGFSSREAATDLSGRGVGLDVVRVRLQSLGGDVELRSVEGKGSTFTLRVPVSLTVAPLLFVEVGDEKVCLTATHVTQALRVGLSQVKELGGRPALKVSDEVLPFASIASILGQAPQRNPSEGELVLLLRGQGATAAISVDRVLEERVQAVFPLRGMLSRFKHLAGATPLADGSLAMVLSANHLISSAKGQAAYQITHLARQAADTKRRILVVDDSPLTRELIASLLETMGYDIVIAVDGIDAFERLSRETVDMVVTDLEMPRMDGLELTRRVKGHPTLRSLPVVIVTTRGSEADRRRGMEAGADGYIAKGDLVRQDLVDVVARLLG